MCVVNKPERVDRVCGGEEAQSSKRASDESLVCFFVTPCNT